VHLNPNESYASFGKPIYRDAAGNCVVADAEGDGRFRLEEGAHDVVVVRGHCAPGKFVGIFRDGLMVHTRELSTVRGRILTDPSFEKPDVPFARVQGPFLGAGWVVGSSSSFAVDQHHEVLERASPGWPIPFFRSIDTPGSFEVLPSATLSIPLVSVEVAGPDAMPPVSFPVQNVTRSVVLKSTFPDGFRRSATVCSHLNAAQFELEVPVGTYGLRLRKVYDAFHGRQRARVLIDSEPLGIWFLPVEDRLNRWRVAEFGVPVPAGKQRLRLTIDPLAGSALWSLSEFQIFGLIGKPSRDGGVY
jgi:hypothetical protein